MKLPSWKAFSLKLVGQLEFMFTVTMNPENGKCKFKDELLTMTAFKEWVETRREIFVPPDVNFAQTPSTSGTGLSC